jgi:hypothetical protein
MLVPKRDLEKQDLLAVRLKAKMAWFDDSGMDRTNGDLMNLFASNPVEVVLKAGPWIRWPLKRGVVWRVASQRLERWVSLGDRGALLRDLALEALGLRGD